MNSYTYVESPIGRLLLSTDGEALTGIYMHLPDGPAPEMKGWARDADAGRAARRPRASSGNISAACAGTSICRCASPARNFSAWSGSIWRTSVMAKR